MPAETGDHVEFFDGGSAWCVVDDEELRGAGGAPMKTTVVLAATASFALVLSTTTACPAVSEGEGEACGADDVLGAFSVAAGFEVVASAAVTDDVALVGISDHDGERRLLVMRQDLAVLDFGVWPTLVEVPEVLFDALAEADRTLTPSIEVFPQFLHVDGALVASAYTRATDFNGEMGGHNLASGNTSYLPASGPFAATTIGETIFVSAIGVADVVEGAGVYAVDGGDVFHIARLTEGAFVGAIASTANGVMIVEQYIDTVGNQLIALGPDDVAGALAGTVIDIGAQTPFVSGGAGAIAAMGEGVAFIAIDESFTALGVRFVGLAATGDAVTATDPVDVLTSAEACTRITTIASFDDDIIVGLSDERGTRLVQLRAR